MTDKTPDRDGLEPTESAAPPAPAGMILRPDLVKGYLPTASKPPDRLFYLLDLQRDLVYEIDGYKLPAENGTKPGWMLVLCCPVCNNHLTLDSTKKKLEVTEEGIESEVFRCSHPAQFGGICSYAIVLDRPKSQAERRVQVHGVWFRVDAVARRA